MTELITLLVAAVLLFLGLDQLRSKEPAKHARMAKELDERADREYLLSQRTREQMAELDRRIQERTDDEPLEMDGADSAADRLRREFGEP